MFLGTPWTERGTTTNTIKNFILQKGLRDISKNKTRKINNQNSKFSHLQPRRCYAIKKFILHMGLENIFEKLNFILYWKSSCEQVFNVEEIAKDNQQ